MEVARLIIARLPNQDAVRAASFTRVIWLAYRWLGREVATDVLDAGFVRFNAASEWCVTRRAACRAMDELRVVFQGGIVNTTAYCRQNRNGQEKAEFGQFTVSHLDVLEIRVHLVSFEITSFMKFLLKCPMQGGVPMESLAHKLADTRVRVDFSIAVWCGVV